MKFIKDYFRKVYLNYKRIDYDELVNILIISFWVTGFLGVFTYLLFYFVLFLISNPYILIPITTAFILYLFITSILLYLEF